VSARRFRELGAARDRSEIDVVPPVGTRARGVQAPELVPLPQRNDYEALDRQELH
jgi:hypothetical protein